ncbi:MAG: MFS transporter, partial [Rhizomicrobium sp.]
AYPLIDLGMMRVQTFSISVQGGSLFRLSLGAVPFLLPLMFQMAFGYSAFASGLMMMAVFAGYVAMKPAITFVIRRYGFRKVLIVNGVLNAVSIAVCAFFDPGLPMLLMVTLLFAGGLSRTLQFTAYNTLAYLDVPKANMNAANTLAAVSMQLSSGMGVALGAIAWRIGLALSHNEEMSFRIAFVVVTVVMLAALWDSFKLPGNTGAHLMRRPN